MHDGHTVGKEFNQLQLSESDIITFHNYNPPTSLKKQIAQLKKYNRPLICTEYMARPKSMFNPSLGIMKAEKVGAINWGLVSGKTQTIYSWEFNKKNATPDMLKVWFHDIFYESGIPYNKKEVEYIKSIMGK